MASQSPNDPMISRFFNGEITEEITELRRIFIDFILHGRIRRDIDGAKGTSCPCVSDDILMTTILFSEMTCSEYLQLRKLLWAPQYTRYNVDWNKIDQQLQRMWEAATTAAREKNIHGYTRWEVDWFRYLEDRSLEPTTSFLANDLILYYDGKFPKKQVIQSVTDNIRVTFASMIPS